LAPGQIAEGQAIALLKLLLEDPGVMKIGQNVKFDWHVFARRGVEVAPFDDTMLISYALDSGTTADGHGMDALAERWLGHQTIHFSDVAGAGRNFIGFARVSVDKATQYAAEDADVTLRLWHVLKPRLVAEGMTTVYETLERPLVVPLARMEERGVSIDREMLARLSGEFALGMAGIEAEAQKLVGAPFNLSSPKQLGDILFGQMGLPGGKKTATGAWSTSASVLEDLAEEGHELPARILDWRQLAKLKSTYTDALPGFVDPRTNRVHTSYALASTTTGRLSSSDPNLQNIPVRNEEGRKIRRAFVAAPGCKLISADYSQIELRLLAHVADIGALKKAFADGLDIHAMTASEMFGVPVKDMPSEVRRRAKAINFGIIYGISAFGLANQLGIPREEAAAYIKKYFERFPGIRDYMEATKRQARADGFVRTIFGRKCHFPRINAANPAERAFNERAAINAPLQGSAADIIRRAMAHMDDALGAAKLGAQMLMQVHDELVFEAPDAEVEATIALVCKVMVDAPEPAVRLSAPLAVDAREARLLRRQEPSHARQIEFRITGGNVERARGRVFVLNGFEGDDDLAAAVAERAGRLHRKALEADRLGHRVEIERRHRRTQGADRRRHFRHEGAETGETRQIVAAQPQVRQLGDANLRRSLAAQDDSVGRAAPCADRAGVAGLLVRDRRRRGRRALAHVRGQRGLDLLALRVGHEGQFVFHLRHRLIHSGADLLDAAGRQLQVAVVLRQQNPHLVQVAAKDDVRRLGGHAQAIRVQDHRPGLRSGGVDRLVQGDHGRRRRGAAGAEDDEGAREADAPCKLTAHCILSPLRPSRLKFRQAGWVEADPPVRSERYRMQAARASAGRSAL
jgi:DNA polymerase I-like protein with 3'-5' exonuclease and polymerase domains